ncbi:helix-turn-helix transcriptional regulator [Corynebacterium sp. CCM 8835]|uniref:Helix-turn-helix transcriptional regulator n=1 Tax=Corynebacterium antarcticum TaxID=2800405 RepID=A0A9Q4CDM3_9CORY|nr:helix-turn-helix transcriptional regulator [Corynebacterium antarcticum]MCK7642923.1 helix-turn-helix transcriptional regulator [Corynebacterium antarcticum]MCK7661426.1 helix-turn-helix transcriptional regulator [Corynebacterium antarcticum]MCL0246163.1 helix-turn-helix transcriptional regulator [Corynebacterium antarcticum]MCX7492413.1 helix-turn-helix transcriptional regulator [Corynebacterium antarcticum]MCX7538475.1 helix-turn-helix transcriptional regulator [Corynebacterium antarcticu
MDSDTTDNLVRKLRRWTELSQAELAERVGVTRQTIANIEKGNYSPSVHLALAICRELGATVEQVFGSEQNTASPTITHERNRR